MINLGKEAVNNTLESFENPDSAKFIMLRGKVRKIIMNPIEKSTVNIDRTRGMEHEIKEEEENKRRGIES